MAEPTTTERIHEFLRDEILFGQGDGLSPTTPLLELGILDSFALLKLVAHLNDTFGVDIRPEQIAGRDFRDIESIARLVARRLGSKKRPPLVGRSTPEGPAIFDAPTCSQVFVMFTGMRGHLAADGRALALHIARFFKRAGLRDRNIIVLGDAQNRSYRDGVSAALPSPEKICEWLARWIAERPHIDEVYTIGISAGTPMAMIAGAYLKARTVWAFGPRVARTEVEDIEGKLARAVEGATGKTIAQLQEEMTDDDRVKIDGCLTPAVQDEYYRSIVDPETVLDGEYLAELAEFLRRSAGATQYFLFYCARDACDARVVEVLRACPGVTAVEVEPSECPPSPWAFARWVPSANWLQRHHAVVDLLRERGQLRGVFPAFRAVGRAATLPTAEVSASERGSSVLLPRRAQD